MSRPRITIFGAGLVGRVIVADLLADEAFQIQVVDGRETALSHLSGDALTTCRADLSSPEEIHRLAAETDLVVGALPGFLGATLLEGVLAAGRPMVDISFTPAYPDHLVRTAREKGIPVVVDCGLAPGLSNLLVGRETADLTETERVEILVGGLPLRRVQPYEYCFVFSPADVMEEYTRPCRFREDGVLKVKPALSDVEQVDLPPVGTLEAFNTDGLRSLLHTIPARTLKEKTLRYPGHAAKMRLLRDTGLLHAAPRRFGSEMVSPRQMTEAVLMDLLRRKPGEEEITLLRVEIQGTCSGRRRLVRWDLVDRTDLENDQTSMARTTAFPCTAVARLLADGSWRTAGLGAPELLGREKELADRILTDLLRRGVHLTRIVKQLPPR